jgi:hypothetical protein
MELILTHILGQHKYSCKEIVEHRPERCMSNVQLPS